MTTLWGALRMAGMESREATESLPRLVFTVQEAATILTVSDRHVWRLIRAGELKVKRSRGRVLIPKWCLDHYLAN